jgi:hypothetical protein
MSNMNSLRDGSQIYSDTAFGQLKNLTIALGQKVLRETTAKEIERVNMLMRLEGL